MMKRLTKIRSALLGCTLMSGFVQPAVAQITDRAFFSANALVVVIAGTEDEANDGQAPFVVDFALLDFTPSGSEAFDLIRGDGFVVNSNSGFDAGHDFSGGATRIDVNDEITGGSFGNPGGGDIDYLEATDSLAAFELDGDTDVNTRDARNVSRFLVASNVAFDIFVESTELTRTGDFTDLDYENIGFRAQLNRSGGSGAGRWGDSAQNPAIGGEGIDETINDLGDMSSGPVKLFDGGRRTAALRGSLLEQSVSFNIRYSLSGSADAANVNDYDLSLGSGTIGAEVSYTVYAP
ncbi:MAG: hypothetical protein ABJ275_12305 [Maricaulaceae bacterium]